MSDGKRFKLVLAIGGMAALVAAGGIAAAEQGGQSAEHRQNPTTTTSAPTTGTVAPTLPPPATDHANGPSDTKGSDTEGAETDTSQSDSNRTAALCHALYQGSERGQDMKAEHGQAFQNLNCQDVAPLGAGHDESADPGESGAAPANSNAGGNGNGNGQGQASDNAHGANGQSHKP